jgi:hypothetical protein
MKCSMTEQEKCVFNTGDCLIEEIAWAGLTVYLNIFSVLFLITSTNRSVDNDSQ